MSVNHFNRVFDILRRRFWSNLRVKPTLAKRNIGIPLPCLSWAVSGPYVLELSLSGYFPADSFILIAGYSW